MHAEALAATKDWFSEMGKEMQIAEDREAAELFAQTVMDHEKKTGLVCVMLDSVEDESDESDDEDDDDDDDDADEADDSDAEPSEVSGSGSDDDDGSDEDEEEDPLWAPDGMKERLENALKVYVPPNAAETLDSLQLTLRLTEAVPGGGAVLAEKVVDAAVNAIGANDKNADADAAFDNAFAATVAMAEADAERTWAHDKKRAAKMIAKLGITWRSLFRDLQKTRREPRRRAARFTSAGGERRRGAGDVPGSAVRGEVARDGSDGKQVLRGRGRGRIGEGEEARESGVSGTNEGRVDQ